MYAVNEGVEWMILTNGQVRQIWHVTAGLPVVLDIALEVDILGDGGPAQKADVLFCLGCPRKHSSVASLMSCGR